MKENQLDTDLLLKYKRLKENKLQEIGGYDGPEPTIYGDWQHNGKVTDF